MKKRTILKFLLLIFLLTACSTTVKYKIEHPSKIPMGKVQTVKLNKFEVNGTLDLIYQQDDKIVDQIFNFAETKITQSSGNKAIKQYMFSNLLNKIANNQLYDVTENPNVYDAVIKGDIHYSVQDDHTKNKKEVKEKGGDGKTKTVTKYTYTLSRIANVTVNIRVNDNNGNIIGTSSVNKSTTEQITENSLELAQENIENWQLIVNNTLNKTLTPIKHMVLPYHTFEQLSLKTGHSKLIKSANKKAKKGNWQKALEVWNSKKESGNKEDRIASLYNIAVYHEVHDDLDESISIFEKLNLLSNSDKFNKDIERVKQRKKEEKQLQEETGNKDGMKK